jgi:glycosyltransferase involved in cell wall biosynthesis
MNVAKNKVIFYSSVGGSPFISKMLSVWVDNGYAVGLCYAISDEKYRSECGFLTRCILRFRTHAGFALQCIFSTIKSLTAIRIVTTNPFYAPWLVKNLAFGLGPTINLVYDLYPDALWETGALTQSSIFSRPIEWVTRQSIQNCDISVFLGERLREHAEKKYGKAKRSVVIPVGADGTSFRDCPPELTNSLQKITVLYSGKMGRLHDYETVSAVMKNGVPLQVKFRFHASGRNFDLLKRDCGDIADCYFSGPLLNNDWVKTMLDAQVALITMIVGAENVLLPSKTYSALVAGQAILAVCPTDSDLADIVREHDCGWVVEPGDFTTLSAVIQNLVRDPAGLHKKRLNSFQVGHNIFDSSVVALDWIKLFDQSIRH